MEKYLKIKVIPGAAKTEIKEKMSDGTLKVAVAAPAEKGKANKELIRFLEKEYQAVGQIISGSASRIKLIKITL